MPALGHRCTAVSPGEVADGHWDNPGLFRGATGARQLRKDLPFTDSHADTSSKVETDRAAELLVGGGSSAALSHTRGTRKQYVPTFRILCQAPSSHVAGRSWPPGVAPKRMCRTLTRLTSVSSSGQVRHATTSDTPAVSGKPRACASEASVSLPPTTLETSSSPESLRVSSLLHLGAKAPFLSLLPLPVTRRWGREKHPYGAAPTGKWTSEIYFSCDCVEGVNVSKFALRAVNTVYGFFKRFCICICICI